MSTETIPAENVLDLDAAIRESRYPDGIEMPYKGVVYTLPADLPVDVFDPFMGDGFDLPGLLTTLFAIEGDNVADAIISVLRGRPGLPRDFKTALYASLEILLGPEQWATFQATRPGVLTIAAMIRGAFKMYGVSLGEAFGSRASFDDAGDTPKETSSSTTTSTSETPTGAPASDTASSESADSAT